MSNKLGLKKRREQLIGKPSMQPYCYSAGCSWHGPISTVGKTAPLPAATVDIGGGKKMPLPTGGLPCCPHCGSMLFQVDSETTWWTGAQLHDTKGHTNYLDFMKWTATQKRCWKSLREAAVDYTAATGRTVKFDL